LKTEESLRLYYQQELERINQLPYSQGDNKVKVLGFIGRSILKALDAYGETYVSIANSILYGDKE